MSSSVGHVAAVMCVGVLFQTLENREVPLIQRWSNPKKVRLTSAGMALAANLYRHAVESGRMQPHPEVGYCYCYKLSH
jgi:hypothetical protein